MILSIGFTSFSNPFSKSDPTTQTYALFAMSNPVKLRPELVSKPELVIKNSSTPTTAFSGSVFVASYLISAADVAVNDNEVWVKGYPYLFLNATASGYEIIGLMITRSFPPRLRVVFSYCFRLNVLAPIDAKSDEIVFSSAETTVRMLTRAVIPIAIINTVRTVLNNCVLMEPKAIRIFSLNNFTIIAV